MSGQPISDEKYLEDVGFPGQSPFTRGVYPTMYRGRLWTMRQYAGFGSASEANKRFHFLLSKGQRALSVAFDLPTQLGLDADDQSARGEVGRVGVSVCDLSDMLTLFDGIDVAKVSASMTINATASSLLALYLLNAEQQNIASERLRGTVQNDILKEFIARGNYIYPPDASLRLTTDVIAYCAQKLPSWYPISISGYHIREAGATAVQELGFTFANAIAYVNAAQNAKLNIDDIAGRLSFFFSVDNDFLEEIAKFRAARRLWQHILHKRFKLAGGVARKVAGLRFHAQTAGSTLTAQQPRNNIIRVSLQALAAILGGAQSLHTNAWDEALALPSEESVTLALRTQQIIAEESHIDQTIDPVAGSMVIEELTDGLFHEALKVIETIDQQGGACKAVENQYYQHEIAESAFLHQQAIEKKERKVVGVNAYRSENETANQVGSVWSLDPKMEQRKQDELHKRRSARSANKVQSQLDQLATLAAKPDENLMPAILDCYRHGATLGEVSTSLLKEFGKYTGGISL